MLVGTGARKRSVIGLIVGMLGLLLAPAQAGAVTVTLGRPTLQYTSFGTGGPTFVQTALSEPGALVSAPADGVITQWRLLAGSGGTAQLRVLRPAGGGMFTAAGTSASVTPNNTLLTSSSSLPIQVGDYIGIDAQATYYADQFGQASNFSNNLADGDTAAPSASHPYELMFNADVVLDVPVVIGVSPSSGSGGDTVTISGQHLANASSVKFGSVAAGIVSNSNRQIVVVAPDQPPGTAHVTVSTVAGISTPSGANTFAYTAPTAPGTTLPRATIAALTQTHPVFRVGAKSTPLLGRTTRSFPRGTTFSFRLDQPATVTLRIQRKLPGRRVGRVCKRPSPSLRFRPRCTRPVLKAVLRRTARVGLNKTAFSGRIRRRPLKPGRYRAAFTAANTAGTSAPRALSFRIVSP